MVSDMDNESYKCKVCGEPIDMFDYKYRNGMCNSCIIDETKMKQSEAIRNALTTRKETAKEILNMGKKLYEMTYYKSKAMPRLIEWIKVEYGVEIEE